jgi:hypothetical protein
MKSKCQQQILELCVRCCACLPPSSWSSWVVKHSSGGGVKQGGVGAAGDGVLKEQCQLKAAHVGGCGSLKSQGAQGGATCGCGSDRVGAGRLQCELGNGN